MQYIKIYGGLGNQIFQYAFALYLRKKGFDVTLDKFFFDDYKLHKISIQNFNISLKFAKWSDVNNYYIFKNKFFSNKIKIISNKAYILISYLLFKKIINFKNFNEKKINNNFYFDDYWQSLKFVDNVKAELQNEIKIKKKNIRHQLFINQINKKKNSVAIHIRHYNAKNEDTFHGNLSLEYYQKAVKIIKKKINKPFFYIFSNDPNEITKKINLKKNEFKVVNNFKDYEDLVSISICKHQIIANSTFSWWGAWLNKNKSKLVISPKKWFLKEKLPKDLIPNDWYKI